MFDMTFALESIRRRWWIILLAAAVACAIGLVGEITEEKTPLAPSYTAEAAIYVNADRDSESGNLTVSTEGGVYLANDARRIVLNDTVAGEVRRTLGEDILISTPIWQNDSTKVENKTMFVFIDATADEESRALEAANMAATLAVDRINAEFDGATAAISDAAALKTRTSGVANFGSDDLDVSPIEQAASSVSVKKLVIFAGAGLIIGIACVIIVEYCRRRIRSAHDVERLLGVPVIETLKAEQTTEQESYARCGGIIEALAKRRCLESVCLVGWSLADEAHIMESLLNSHMDTVSIVGSADLASPHNDARALSKSDSIVLIVSTNKQSALELDSFLKSIVALDLPILGSIYLEQ